MTLSWGRSFGVFTRRIENDYLSGYVTSLAALTPPQDDGLLRAVADYLVTRTYHSYPPWPLQKRTRRLFL